MARISRRRPRPLCPAGLYLRLSVEGDSLSGQEVLLRSALASHPELTLGGIYTDNGCSGTDFSRPGFRQLMEDVTRGRIRCILVKDLSRLGRNYLETGRLLEEVFPSLGVRFLSVTEGYDSMSSQEPGLMLPLRGLINEAYARDISRKVSASLEARRASGKFMGRHAPFGYQKDPGDHTRLIPDPAAAPLVPELFRQRTEGVSLEALAGQLRARGFPMTRDTVRRILSDQVYLGRTVYGKTVRSFARGIPRQRLPRSQWKTVPGTHPPLVTEALFDAVQNTFQKEDSHDRPVSAPLQGE